MNWKWTAKRNDVINETGNWSYQDDRLDNAEYWAKLAFDYIVPSPYHTTRIVRKDSSYSIQNMVKCFGKAWNVLDSIHLKEQNSDDAQPTNINSFEFRVCFEQPTKWMWRTKKEKRRKKREQVEANKSDGEHKIHRNDTLHERENYKWIKLWFRFGFKHNFGIFNQCGNVNTKIRIGYDGMSE